MKKELLTKISSIIDSLEDKKSVLANDLNILFEKIAAEDFSTWETIVNTFDLDKIPAAHHMGEAKKQEVASKKPDNTGQITFLKGIFVKGLDNEIYNFKTEKQIYEYLKKNKIHVDGVVESILRDNKLFKEKESILKAAYSERFDLALKAAKQKGLIK